YDDFNYKVCELERDMSLDEIKAKLDTWEEHAGTFTPLGDRGARFSPDDWAFPTVYFASDGRTIEVVTKDCDLYDVDNYLCKLAQLLGCKIVTEHLEYF
ncbi:MAG: hypothetical protein JSV00_02125, partial [bacterium]